MVMKTPQSLEVLVPIGASAFLQADRSPHPTT